MHVPDKAVGQLGEGNKEGELAGLHLGIFLGICHILSRPKRVP